MPQVHVGIESADALQRIGWVEVECIELHATLGMILVYMHETTDVFASAAFEAVTTSCMCMGWS